MEETDSRRMMKELRIVKWIIKLVYNTSSNLGAGKASRGSRAAYAFVKPKILMKDCGAGEIEGQYVVTFVVMAWRSVPDKP